MIMRGAEVSRAARQEEVVALSTNKAKYIRLCTGIKEITCFCRFEQRILVVRSSRSTTCIHVDNQSCIRLQRLRM